jgi:hypothetical protein
MGVELTFYPPQGGKARRKVRIALAVSFVCLLLFTLWATKSGEDAMSALPGQIAQYLRSTGQPSSDVHPAETPVTASTPKLAPKKPTPNVKITFQSSQFLDGKPESRVRIERDINQAYEYLKKQGFNPSTDSPVIGTIALAKRPNGACGGVTTGQCPGSLQEQRIQLLQSDVDRPQCVKRLYMGFAFSQILGGCNSGDEALFTSMTSSAFADYFSSSAQGHREQNGDQLGDALWEIRQKYGEHLVDNALLFMSNEGKMVERERRGRPQAKTRHSLLSLPIAFDRHCPFRTATSCATFRGYLRS